MEQEFNLSFKIANRLISIQEVEGGYDYSIMDLNYHEIDGGIYDNQNVTIRQALDDIIEDLINSPDYNGAKGTISNRDVWEPLDYDEVIEKAEMANRIGSEVLKSRSIMDFKAKTLEKFHMIGDQDPEAIEETVAAYIKSIIEEYEIDAEIVDLAVSGSRSRGIEKETSDLDIVVELNTKEREDFLFNTFNQYGLCIAGIKVDINPITRFQTGTLDQYLSEAEKYLERKAEDMREKNSDTAFDIETDEVISIGYKLYSAVKAGNTEQVKELIEAGADVNYVFRPEEYRLTSLHMAAYYAMDEIIEILIENGSEVNRCTIDGKTPLALAKERHNRENTISLLMKYGAVDGTGPIPDFAKVGEVFLTSKNIYFLIKDDGRIQEFQKSEFQQLLKAREKLNKSNEEVAIDFLNEEQIRTNVYYEYTLPETLPGCKNDEQSILTEQMQKRHMRHGR